jgi:hypothetical protein
MTIVIHDCECFSSCEKSCVFHAKHACFRIINREVDHFDSFKIEIEFFVRFFLKFIENDRLSWMKNAVNSDWWMRKWVVDKTKMRRWVIFDLKDCFFFSFLLKHLLLFIHLLSFFKQFSKTFEAFHHVVCVRIFSFCREEVDNSLDKLRNWKSFSCSFDVSLKSMIKISWKKIWKECIESFSSHRRRRLTHLSFFVEDLRKFFIIFLTLLMFSSFIHSLFECEYSSHLIK